MKKLKLDAEALRVESFAPGDRDPAGRGTVEGHATIRCTGYGSCYGSCPGTCNLDTCYSCTQGYSCFTCHDC